MRDSCLYNGFFQIVGHSVPLAQQKAAMGGAKKFFAMPLEEKQKVAKENTTWNRGYEMLRSQILEEGTQPELKEGFYIGAEIPEDHPYFINKKLNSGPNQWPEGLGSDLQSFRDSSMEYYSSALKLASDLMRVIALSLDLEETYFSKFMDGAVATMRLLHYPSQPKDADEKLTRGIGAHTDFGAITMLLQDEVDGLQVWDKKNETWIDVSGTPTPHYRAPLLITSYFNNANHPLLGPTNGRCLCCELGQSHGQMDQRVVQEQHSQGYQQVWPGALLNPRFRFWQPRLPG